MAISKLTTLSIIGAICLLTACDKSPTCDDKRVIKTVKAKFQEVLHLTDEQRDEIEITDVRPIRYRENVRTYRCAGYMGGEINGRTMPKTEIHYSLHVADNDKDFIVSYE